MLDSWFLAEDLCVVQWHARRCMLYLDALLMSLHKRVWQEIGMGIGYITDITLPAIYSKFISLGKTKTK